MKTALLSLVIASGIVGLSGCSSSTSQPAAAAGANGSPPPEDSGAGAETAGKKGGSRIPGAPK